MKFPVVRCNPQVPVREVRRRLSSRHILKGDAIGLFALLVLLRFAGQSGQTQGPVTPGKTGERSEVSASVHWVPFVANRFQASTPDWPGHLPERIVLGGPYLRNEEGSSYQRLRLVSKNSVPIKVSDIGMLFDRPKGLSNNIDYAHHMVEVRREESDELFFRGKDPPTREQFVASHASDQYVGTSSFEGFECDLYKIRTKGKKNKFHGTVCYAPALNFLAIRAQIQTPQGLQIETYFTEIQIGRRPGTDYFQIPAGFKIIDKTK